MARHQTPLRYPGGKQKLTPFIREVLECNSAIGCDYVEPYAGGAGVAMELLLSRDVRRVHLNDSSRHIYAFWHSVKHNADQLCRMISSASLSLDEWSRRRAVIRTPDEHDLLELGYSTFYMNRCNRSGVLTAGVIGGKAQTGTYRIDARFPRNELIRRIETIAARADDILVSNLDAEEFILKKVNPLRVRTFVYLDPPYFERAKRLYLNTYREEDHSRVAALVQTTLRQPWVVSYDGHPSILELYVERRKFIYSIQYSAINAYAGSEVFIFSDTVRIPNESALPYVGTELALLDEQMKRPKVSSRLGSATAR